MYFYPHIPWGNIMSLTDQIVIRKPFCLLEVYVLKRPYVDEFLQRMGELFECVLFTASLAKVFRIGLASHITFLFPDALANCVTLCVILFLLLPLRCFPCFGSSE